MVTQRPTMIHTDEGSYEAHDITAMGAAQRARSRDELERKAIADEADDSWEAHLDRLSMS